MTEIDAFLRDALECSVHADPLNYGLSRDEIHSISQEMGFRPGEVDDALRKLKSRARLGQARIQPDPDFIRINFFGLDEPELRSPEAFEFVITCLHELKRDVGQKQAVMPRQTLVEKGVSTGYSRHDLEVACTFYLLAEWLEEAPEGLRLSAFGSTYALPSQQLRENHGRSMVRPGLARLLSVVKDVVARRGDGRARYPNPLDAFREALESLGHSRFRLWWTQTVSELRLTNPATTPMSACVVSAALSEGALVFVVEHALKVNVGPMGSKTFKEPSTRWKFEELIASAAAGGREAILNPKVRDRAERLNLIRQRIHAGRLMADIPTGHIPDVRPEEAREAIETLSQVVRSILDWLDAHPAPAQASAT